MNSCSSNFSLTPKPNNCSLLTFNDWFNGTTGSCRLRIKNFNAADWISGGCGTCTNAGGKTWDGTFPLFVPNGLSPFYQVDPTTGNIGGKTPLFGSNCACGFLNGVGWYVALSCNGAPAQFIWSSDFHPFGGGPLVTYNRNQGCVLALSFVVEAYSL